MGECAQGETAANVAYTGTATDAEAIGEFVAKESLALTLAFTPENTDKIFSAGIPRHLILLAKPDDLVSGSALMKEFRGAAQALKGQFVFVTVDAESENAEPVISFFGLDAAAAPTLVGFVVRCCLAPALWQGACSLASTCLLCWTA